MWNCGTLSEVVASVAVSKGCFFVGLIFWFNVSSDLVRKYNYGHGGNFNRNDNKNGDE